MQSVFQTGQPIVQEFEFVPPKGLLNVEAHLVPERDDGHVRSVLMVLRDITARKRAEAILRESEQQFRIVANDIPAFLWMTSPTGENSFINRPLAAFLGIPEHNTLPSWAWVVHPEDAVRAHDKFLDSLTRRVEHWSEFRLRRFGVKRTDVDGFEMRHVAVVGKVIGKTSDPIRIGHRMFVAQKLLRRKRPIAGKVC